MNWKLTLLTFLAFPAVHGWSQNYLMNAATTSITDCSGFFLDSGGGNANYGPNQNFTTTICPDLTTGTHVQLVFSGTELGAGDDICFFDGNTTAAPSLGCASDFAGAEAFIIQATAVNPGGCLTLTFNSNGSDQGAGWSADINCIPACQTILSVLSSTNPVVEPADTGWIDICPGERVFFNGTGSYPQNGLVYNHSNLTSDFEWDFGDGTITYGPNVSKIYDEPGGFIVQLKITDQFGCDNTNFISQRVRVAPRPTFALGPFVDQICAGDTVQLNAMVDSLDATGHTVSVLPGEEGFQTAGIRSDSLALPDGDGNSYTTTISFADFSPGQILTNINDLFGIWITMEHSWLRDLQIRLTCPNGNTAILHNHPGQIGGEVFLGVPNETDEGGGMPIPGIGWDYGWQSNPDFNYTWIEYANQFNPNSLPAGSYESYQPLTNFLGCPLNGDWEIEVTDLWAIDNGFIFSWSIEFNPDLYPELETFSPALVDYSWNFHPSITESTNDAITGSPVNAGEVAYVFTVTDEFGCPWDTTVEIQVLPFTHPLCHNCNDNLTPVPDSTVCQGEPVLMNSGATITPNSQVTFENYEDYAIGASNHPTINPYQSVISVNSINPGTISTPLVSIASVCVDLSTDFDSDIQIFLRSPNNQNLMLSTNNGGSGDNYTNTCFTPSALQNITTGSAPFTGNYLPEGSWAVLNNTPINGDWTLRVSDQFGVNAMGNLNWWSITFNSTNNVTYTWSPPTGLSCNNCPAPTATPMNNMNYVVTALDSYGCVSKDTVQIAVLNSFSAPTVTCEQQSNGQIEVNWNDVSPGLSYEVNINGTGWTSANNGDLSHLINGLVNGDDVNIQVRANVNGAACTVGIGTSLCTYFNCPIEATVAAGPFAVTCSGNCDESVTVNVTGASTPLSFEINNLTLNTSVAQASNVLTGLCPGNYQVIVTEDAGCTDEVMFTVGEPPVINISASQSSPVTCNGGNDGIATVSANGGAGGITFLWGNPNMSTGTTVTGLEAGPISVTATDANGCQETASVNITEPPAVTAVLSETDVNCFGGMDGTATVLASGGNGNYTFQWSGGTTPTAATTGGLSAGAYSVTVMDANQCQGFGNILVGQPATGVEVTAVQTFKGCWGSNFSEASANATGGDGNYSFQWIYEQPQAPVLPGQDVQFLKPGFYTVVATDGNGCTNSTMIEIIEWPVIMISISFVPPTCHGSSDGSMAANIVTGGDGVYSYLWNTGATDAFITNLQGGLTYTVTVTDSQGCQGAKPSTLPDPPAIQVITQEIDAKCFASADGTSTITNVLNAVGNNLTYQWDAFALDQTTPAADSLPAGNYSVVVTDSLGCTGEAAVVIGDPTAIEVEFEVVDNECFGEEEGAAEIEVTGGVPNYTYDWSNGGAAAKIVELAADTFFVTITDANGCQVIDSVVVEQPAAVDALITILDASCFGDKDGSIKIEPIGGTQPFLYSIDGENYYGSSTLIALAAEEYTVYIKDAKDCIYLEEAIVGEPPLMTLDILSNGADSTDLTINYGDQVVLDASVNNSIGVVEYNWTASWCGTLTCGAATDCDSTMLDCITVVATPDYANDYFLTVTDEHGCVAEDMVQIQVRKFRRIRVPTGFTPNGDNTNDLLTVHGIHATKILYFQVFDRWGELLFEQPEFPINDVTMGWDGKFKNKDMPSGVYVWYLVAEFEDGMTESYKGETTLIR